MARLNFSLMMRKRSSGTAGSSSANGSRTSHLRASKSPSKTNPKSPTPLDHWNGGPTGAREIGPHRGGGGKREKAISPGRGGAEEEIVNAHLSLGLEIIPIVHRNYDGWTIRWSLPARRPTWDHEFESDFLQRRVCRYPFDRKHLGPRGTAGRYIRPARPS